VLISRFFKNAKLTVIGITRDNDWMRFWETHFLPKGLPLLLGLGLGTLLAVFIVEEAWPLVFGLLFLIPAAVLFNAYPFAALIIWVSLMPFLQTTVNSTYRHIFWIIHRAVPPAALGVILLANLLKVTKRQYVVRLGRAELAMAIYLGLAGLNIFWFQSSPMAYLYLFYDRVFVPFCLYWFIRLVAPQDSDLKRLIPVAFIIVLVECVVGLLSWFAPEVLPPEWLGAQGRRTTGTVGYPHVYTTTLVFFSFLLFQAAMNRKPGVVRSAFLFTFGLGAIGVFLSFSRGSWVGGLTAATGLLVMYPRTMIRMLIILLVLMAILGSGVLSDQMAFARERVNSEDTARGRWVLWYAGLQMIGTKPFFGWGYGDYDRHAWQFQTRVRNHVAINRHASHNSYIAVAAEMGLPAFFLLMFPVLWWLMLTPRVWPHMPKEGFWSRSLLIVFWMVILDHVLVNFFSDMRHSSYGMSMWWITLGLIANMVDAYLQPEDMRMPKWIQRVSQAAW
jgi:O-antigen ligase